MPNDDVIKEILISTPIQDVWVALTTPNIIAAWMGDDSVVIDLTVGGRYAFFGGETTGVFTRIEAPYRLAYTWRQAGWSPDWAASLVEWELRATETGTALRLVHSQFPTEEERDGHDEGWDIYWLEPMVAWLEGEGSGE